MNNIIACATPRLANSMRLAHQQQQLATGYTQWQSPNIITLSEWLNQCIEVAILNGDIDATIAPSAALTSDQEGLLWEQAIQQSLHKHIATELFDTNGLASAASEANRYLIEWNISLDVANLTEESRQFLQWRQKFYKLCKQADRLESVRYLAWQIECINQGAGQLPSKITLAGFDRVHPHLKRLIQVLTARGTTVEISDYTSLSTQNTLHVVLPDLDSECRAAVAWAQATLNAQTNAKLAIVVPDLGALRHKLGQLLDDAFHPEASAPAHAEMQRCYDFSLGVPLSTCPIISTALALLRLGWQQQPLLQTDVAFLLHSPYWSSHQREADARAQLDARMRQQLPLNFHPKRLLSLIQSVLQADAPLALTQLVQDYTALASQATKHARTQIPSQWAATFQQALSDTHWPGDRSLSSHEYQATQSFERVMQALCQMDNLLGNISPHEAIKRLTQLCKAQIFQPENASNPPIMVMGLLEASAETLDAIWVLGMNDHVWPPAARPNALIPADLQRNANTPNASSQVQSEFAQAVHQRLIRSANQVTFSSAKADGERQLRASPLMHSIALCPNPRPLLHTLAEQLCNQDYSNWQWLADQQAPPVLEQEHVSGGTALLKAQAICPAWAFYQYRLGAKKLHTPVNGLDVMERGNLVHAVLAEFWQKQDSSQLQDSIASLTSSLHTIATNVVQRFNAEKQGALTTAFIQLEIERLSKLAMTWLIEVEMKRPQAFRVQACEQTHHITLEGINIKLIIDRVDALDNGQLAVIDYKTGRQMDFKNWAHTAISEPQLPIYAAFVLQDADVAAVCFAKLRPAEFGFVGIAAQAELLQGLITLEDKRGRALFNESQFPNWQSIITHWQQSITATARALKQGDAAVIFENENQLAFCEVIPLLRLPERWLQYEYTIKTDLTP